MATVAGSHPEDVVLVDPRARTRMFLIHPPPFLGCAFYLLVPQGMFQGCSLETINVVETI